MEAKHKIQNCKLSEENRVQYINDLGVWRDFLNVTKAQTIRNQIKIETGHKLGGGNLQYMQLKGRIKFEDPHKSLRKKDKPNIKCVKDISPHRHFTKERKSEQPIDVKRCSTSLVIEKCKLKPSFQIQQIG